MIFFCAILECVAVVERVHVTAAAALTDGMASRVGDGEIE